jgi:protein-tyrosine phosphatase
MMNILFLCTGNFYRSRFAEVLFNHLAAQLAIPARADSRGLRVKPDGVVNVGPISPHALQGLKSRDLPLPPTRYPQQLTWSDLESAHMIIALKDAEHRPLMERLFPEFASRVRYWNVHDLDVALPQAALAELEVLIRGLLAEVSGRPQCPMSANN